ncbi:hypothetical protein [Microbacter margulisiae]|uniref:DUF3575 domain-containing protein n=1 Tax=Microbacter margulisiae TaxID=1350067 RepID=A0A7W5DRT3_9PORP|nr:hypothetical protein [Microbacter margulisiae]MBB3187901.1 hypothetical protein [Microbacter margulisiae]
MKKRFFLFVCLFLASVSLFAQRDSLLVKPVAESTPKTYEVKSAIEVESLVPMFLTGGFHFCIGYRFYRFRIRLSVINGGHYDAEPAGIKNSSNDFKRFYKTSPGVFFGYNIWRNLELYTYLELHTFQIEQESTGICKDLHSTDTGLGISYQFFIGKIFYVQPGFHLYLRADKRLDFGPVIYSIPNVDFSPVLRLGVRLWSKSK